MVEVKVDTWEGTIATVGGGEPGEEQGFLAKYWPYLAGGTGAGVLLLALRLTKKK